MGSGSEDCLKTPRVDRLAIHGAFEDLQGAAVGAGRGDLGDLRAVPALSWRMKQDPLTIYVRPIASVTPQRLPGTDNASQLFWSADSQWIGYFAQGKLAKVSITGGPPATGSNVHVNLATSVA